MIISCKHASNLISLAEDRALSIRERIQLQIHLFICRCCLAFQKNLKTLRRGLKELAQTESTEAISVEEREFQERLQQVVQRKIDGND